MNGPAKQNDERDLDCEGLLCPLPVLRARKVLAGMAKGEILRIRATDPMAAIDLPHFCAEAGHVYLGSVTDGEVQLHRVKVGL